MKGIFTALITPFKDNGVSIDYSALDRIVDDQIRQKVDGIVVCGTTAESATLSDPEKKELFTWMRKRVQGTSLKLIAGTGTNDTRDTIRRTQECFDLGYDQFLIVTPYYNKPQESGLLKHFTAVADATAGEVILYNVPGRTGLNLSAKLITELAAHPRIRSLKEASGDLTLASEIHSELARAKRGLDLLSGDDATFFPFLCAGGVGTISVASHLWAIPMRQIQECVERGDLASARKIQDEYLPAFKRLFVESNPVPVKYALSKRLGFSPNVRLPLAELSPENVNVWDRLLMETRFP